MSMLQLLIAIVTSYGTNQHHGIFLGAMGLDGGILATIFNDE